MSPLDIACLESRSNHPLQVNSDRAVAREILSPDKPRTLQHEGDAGQMPFPQASVSDAPHAQMSLPKKPCEEMNCEAVAWALAQDASSASASRLLIEIARWSRAGVSSQTQTALGLACKLSERQTRTLLASLAADGLVGRQRNGGAGAGRAPDTYTLIGYVEKAEAEQPAIIAGSQIATGSETQVAATGNGQSSPVAPMQPAETDRKSLPVGATGNGAPTPPIRTTSKVEGSSEPTEPSFEGVQGEKLFDLPEPPPKKKTSGTSRRPRREKFYATELTMPAAPNDEMRKYATEKKLINGTLQDQYGKFCRWHIRKRTLIASLEQRWETWVDNWSKDNPVKPDGAPPGYKLAGVGPDGKPRYNRDHRQNFYRS